MLPPLSPIPPKAPDPARPSPADDTAQPAQPPAALPAPSRAAPPPHTHTPSTSAGRCSSTPPPHAASATAPACTPQTHRAAPPPDAHAAGFFPKAASIPRKICATSRSSVAGLHGQRRAPRMQNHIHRKRHRRRMPPHALAQPPLDPVPLHCLAQHLAYRQPHPRPRRIAPTALRPQRVEKAHLLGKLLPRRRVHALVVRVFPQTQQRIRSLRWHRSILRPHHGTSI